MACKARRLVVYTEAEIEDRGQVSRHGRERCHVL